MKVYFTSKTSLSSSKNSHSKMISTIMKYKNLKNILYLELYVSNP